MASKLEGVTRAGGVLLLSLVMVVTSGWVGDGLKGECLFPLWLGECGDNPLRILCRALPAFAGFMVSAWLAFHLAKGWLPVRHLAQNQSVRTHKVLIAPISLFNPLPACSGGSCWVEDTRSGKRVEFTGDLANDIEAFNTYGWRWNGQQFLRGLEPHVAAGAMTDLVLIGSSGKFASYAGLTVTKEVVGLYSKVSVQLHPDPIDFENIQALQQVFEGWIKTFHERGVPEREILLDATGGQKTTSIAAALTTLRWSQVEFQYVESKDVVTAGEKPNVLSFNVVIETPQKELGS